MLRWLFWLLFLPFTVPLAALRAVVSALWPRNTLDVTIRGAVPDRKAGGFPRSRSTPLLTIVSALAQAEADTRVRRVLVKVEGFQGGLGRAEELRSALERVRLAGKEVIVFAEHLDLQSYWLALGATRIHLAPTGSLDVVGVASEFTLWKGLLDKAGVSARLLARGKYKSFREAFAEGEISEANREMLRDLVSDLGQQLHQRIAKGRSLPLADVPGKLDEGPFRADQAHAAGLVDAPGYEDELKKELEEREKVRSLGVASYLRRRQRRWLPLRPPRVALLEVEGSIQLGDEGGGAIRPRASSARDFIAACERIGKDKSIRAILLRVNSPGGSALASDLMWHALTRARKERPLVVSMANLAASGGYYVSATKGARVFASPTTLTGSIGVVGGKFELSRLQERLGIKKEIVAVGRHASFHSPSVDFTEEELRKLGADIDASYDDFVRKVAAGRGSDVESVDRVAQGRVWTGARAVEHGLVDEMGGLRDALDALRRELELAPSAPLGLQVVERRGLLERVRRGLGASLFDFVVPEALRAAFVPMSRDTLWYRLPFDVRIH